MKRRGMLKATAAAISAAITKAATMAAALPSKGADEKWETPGVVEFNKDDRDYLRWLAAHPKGFVVNTERGYSPRYMMLHRSTCTTISKIKPPAKPGGFTERGYVKICSDSVEALQRWCKEHGSANGSFSKRCPVCKS